MQREARKRLLEAISKDFGYEAHAKCQALLREILQLKDSKTGYSGLSFKDLHKLASEVELSTLLYMLDDSYFPNEAKFLKEKKYGEIVSSRSDVRDFIIRSLLFASSIPKRKGGVRNG